MRLSRRFSDNQRQEGRKAWPAGVFLLGHISVGSCYVHVTWVYCTLDFTKGEVTWKVTIEPACTNVKYLFSERHYM